MSTCWGVQNTMPVLAILALLVEQTESSSPSSSELISPLKQMVRRGKNGDMPSSVLGRFIAAALGSGFHLKNSEWGKQIYEPNLVAGFENFSVHLPIAQVEVCNHSETSWSALITILLVIDQSQTSGQATQLLGVCLLFGNIVQDDLDVAMRRTLVRTAQVPASWCSSWIPGETMIFLSCHVIFGPPGPNIVEIRGPPLKYLYLLPPPGMRRRARCEKNRVLKKQCGARSDNIIIERNQEQKQNHPTVNYHPGKLTLWPPGMRRRARCEKNRV